MMLLIGSVFLGIVTQGLLFAGWPIPWKTLRLTILREGVLAFINEQSLWLITLIYWYLIYRHALFDVNSSYLWVFLGTSIVVTGLVALATFTHIILPNGANILFYLWYLGLDFYISLVFLIRSPSNIFVDIASKSAVDYYFFGMVLLHLFALIYYFLSVFSYKTNLIEWEKHVSDLGSRYKDHQVTALYPLLTTVIAFFVLMVLPRFFPITDFAFVGGLLGIGTFVTGQRAGTQNVGTKPKIK